MLYTWKALSQNVSVYPLEKSYSIQLDTISYYIHQRLFMSVYDDHPNFITRLRFIISLIFPSCTTLDCNRVYEQRIFGQLPQGIRKVLCQTMLLANSYLFVIALS